MKNLSQIINEKLKISNNTIIDNKLNNELKDDVFYNLCKTFLLCAQNNTCSKKDLIKIIDDCFKRVNGLKERLIDYISNCDDFPEPLSDEAEELASYFYDMKPDRFDKYLK